MSRKIFARRQLHSTVIERNKRQEKRATPENPSFSIFDPAMWDMILEGEPSASGIPVSHEKLLKLAAVWQAVSLISGDIAKMHLELKKQEGRIWTPDKGHPAFDLVRWDWNDETTAFDGWRTILVQKLIWNNGYAFIDRNGRDDPIGLYNLLPDRMTPKRVNGEKVYIYETVKPDGSPWHRPIPARDVLHLRGISIDGMEGIDFLKCSRDMMGLALGTERFQAKYFKNGVKAGGILELPREMSDKAKGKVTEGFGREYTGPENWFKTVILRDGAKFHQVSSSLREAQMVELDEQLVRKVARFYSMAPSRLGLSDSVSYNSKSEDNQSYLDSTLSPHMAGMVGECRTKLLSDANRDRRTHEFAHDTSQLLRLNQLGRFQVYSIGRAAGILTQNECREQEGLPPVEGGDDLNSPAKPAGGIDKGGDAPPRGEADPTDGQAPAPKRSDARVAADRRRVVFGMTLQARDKATRPKAFIDWIDGGLQSHRSMAKLCEVDESIVDRFVTEMKAIAEKASSAELVGAVEESAIKWETEE